MKQVLSLLMLAAAVYFAGSGIASSLTEDGISPNEDIVWGLVMLILAGTGLWMAYRSMKVCKLPMLPVFFTGLRIGDVYGIGWAWIC